MGTAIKPTAVKKEKPEEKLKTKKIKRGKRRKRGRKGKGMAFMPEFCFPNFASGSQRIEYFYRVAM